MNKFRGVDIELFTGEKTNRTNLQLPYQPNKCCFTVFYSRMPA